MRGRGRGMDRWTDSCVGFCVCMVCHNIIPNWSSYPMMFPCIHESYVFFHYEEETCFTYRWEIWTQHRMKRKDKTERTFYYTSIIS